MMRMMIVMMMMIVITIMILALAIVTVTVKEMIFVRNGNSERNDIGRWPTVAALAAASLEEVNEMWRGLGYYRRAKCVCVCGPRLLPPRQVNHPLMRIAAAAATVYNA